MAAITAARGVRPTPRSSRPSPCPSTTRTTPVRRAACAHPPDDFRSFVEAFGGAKEGFEPGAAFDDADADGDGSVPKLAGPVPKYMAMLQEVANLQRTAITIDLDDMIEVPRRAARAVLTSP